MSENFEQIGRMKYPLSRFSEMTDQEFGKACINMQGYSAEDQDLIFTEYCRREAKERAKIPYEERLRQRKERRGLR